MRKEIDELSKSKSSQEIRMEEMKAEIKKSNKALDEKESQLKDERSKTKELQDEVQSLKAELQAKIERESRREQNLYALGNCTWYVKEKVPYIGGTWGNANQWLASAKSYGFETGREPKSGDIAVSLEGYYGHVAYVEYIKDGMVTITEMNNAELGGFNVVNSRTVPKNSFIYIHT